MAALGVAVRCAAAALTFVDDVTRADPARLGVGADGTGADAVFTQVFAAVVALLRCHAALTLAPPCPPLTGASDADVEAVAREVSDVVFRTRRCLEAACGVLGSLGTRLLTAPTDAAAGAAAGGGQGVGGYSEAAAWGPLVVGPSPSPHARRRPGGMSPPPAAAAGGAGGAGTASADEVLAVALLLPPGPAAAQLLALGLLRKKGSAKVPQGAFCNVPYCVLHITPNVDIPMSILSWCVCISVCVPLYCVQGSEKEYGAESDYAAASLVGQWAAALAASRPPAENTHSPGTAAGPGKRGEPGEPRGGEAWTWGTWGTWAPSATGRAAAQALVRRAAAGPAAGPAAAAPLAKFFAALAE